MRPPLFGIGHLLRLRADQLGFYRDMQARHGDVVPLRLGPYRSWLLFHPDAAEAVLATQASRFVRFEPVMRVLAQWNGGSLLVSEGRRWQDRRRQVLPAFARSRLPGYGSRIVERTLVLRRAWEAAAAGGGSLALDTDREMVALTLDIAAETLFGERLEGRAAAVGDAVAVLSDVAFRESTSALRWPDWLPLPGKVRKRRAIAEVDALVAGIVAARIAAGGGDRGDLLSMLVEGGRADPVAVRDEVTTLLIAGHETTGALLSWVSHLLARHPDVLGEVQHELDQSLDGRPPEAGDLPHLGLLRAVIEETLRLYPPAYAFFPRRAVEHVELGGVTIRKGELVQLVPFVTQRDPRWFAEPAAFRPSRFLGPPTWPRYAFLPFGAGPRVCIGQAFGMLETALVLATLLQRFSPTSASEAQVEPDPKFSLRPRGGLAQRWVERSGSGRGARG